MIPKLNTQSIVILLFTCFISCKNDEKKSELKHVQEFSVPSFKRDSNFNMTVGEYCLFLDSHNLNVKEIKAIELNKKYTHSSIVIAVEPKPYSFLEKGDSVMIYVRD